MCDDNCTENCSAEKSLFPLEYSPYSNPANIGYKGSYSIDGECVGWLTLDDKFLSILKVYGIDLNENLAIG